MRGDTGSFGVEYNAMLKQYDTFGEYLATLCERVLTRERVDFGQA